MGLGLWHDIKGNAKWDLFKAVGRLFLPSGILAAAIVRWWLIQPVVWAQLIAIWLACLLALLLLWLKTARLTALIPRLEFVSQRGDGLGYKKPGHDTAIVIPFLNQGTFWHAALPESCPVTAHIVFFDSVGNPVEAAYPGMWLNAALCPAKFSIGQVHELILALAQDHKPQIFYVPECHSRRESAADILDTHNQGEMLSLKHLADTRMTLRAEVRLAGPGYSHRGRYELYLDRAEPWADKL